MNCSWHANDSHTVSKNEYHTVDHFAMKNSIFQEDVTDPKSAATPLSV